MNWAQAYTGAASLRASWVTIAVTSLFLAESMEFPSPFCELSLELCPDFKIAVLDNSKGKLATGDMSTREYRDVYVGLTSRNHVSL